MGDRQLCNGTAYHECVLIWRLHVSMSMLCRSRYSLSRVTHPQRESGSFRVLYGSQRGHKSNVNRQRRWKSAFLWKHSVIGLGGEIRKDVVLKAPSTHRLALMVFLLLSRATCFDPISVSSLSAIYA
jgi:hypothetical protein